MRTSRDLSGSSPAPSRRCDFTLLEVVIAVSVFLLVASALFGVSRQVSESWRRLHREQQQFSALMALDRTLNMILGNAVPFTWQDENRRPILVFYGEADAVSLVYQHRVNDPYEGALRFVTISVVDRDLVAAYQERPPVDISGPGDAALASILASGVERITVSYADADEVGEIQWQDEWDEERNVMPLAISLVVEWEDGSVESWLRRTAGSGRRERWGKWNADRDQGNRTPTLP